MNLQFKLNGQETSVEIDPAEGLLDLLRRLGLTSPKRGCEDGACGACSVLVDGALYNACLLFAAQVQDREVLTVEGLGTIASPHPLQTAFVEEGAVQCGYCMPGMLLAAKALLDRRPDPTEQEINEALDGNLCRCTGYVKPVVAVKKAAKVLSAERSCSDEEVSR